jgi:preprotein translocase subunit SecG
MGFLTGTVLFFFVLTSVFLILLVLFQSGKGGNAMNMMGGASQTAFGSSSADILTKTTRVTALSFILFSLLLSFLFAKKEDKVPVIEDSSAPSISLPPNTDTLPNTESKQ